jgi:hypothetical protein
MMFDATSMFMGFLLGFLTSWILFLVLLSGGVHEKS